MGFIQSSLYLLFVLVILPKCTIKIKIILLSYIVSFKDDLFDFALSCASSCFSVCLFLFINQFRIVE